MLSTVVAHWLSVPAAMHSFDVLSLCWDVHSVWTNSVLNRQLFFAID